VDPRHSSDFLQGQVLSFLDSSDDHVLCGMDAREWGETQEQEEDEDLEPVEEDQGEDGCGGTGFGRGLLREREETVGQLGEAVDDSGGDKVEAHEESAGGGEAEVAGSGPKGAGGEVDAGGGGEAADGRDDGLSGEGGEEVAREEQAEVAAVGGEDGDGGRGVLAEEIGQAGERLMLRGHDGEGPHHLGNTRRPKGMLGIIRAGGDSEEIDLGDDADDVGALTDREGGHAAGAQEPNRLGRGILGGQGGCVFDYVVEVANGHCGLEAAGLPPAQAVWYDTTLRRIS